MKAFIWLVALMGWAATSAAGAAANSIDDLNGYWTGSGSVLLASGNTERVKCAVTYKVTNGGGQIRQNLRCASTDYKIEAHAELQVKGGQVTGSWEERTYSATGQVRGHYTGSDFVLAIEGANFSAAMNISLSNCKQSISISPRGLDVTRISLGLGKC